MVTPSLYVRKGGVRTQGLHSPISCESADFLSAHPQLVGLCRVLNPIFHGSMDSCMTYILVRKYNCGRFLELEMILQPKKHPIIGLGSRDTVLNVQLLNDGLCGCNFYCGD